MGYPRAFHYAATLALGLATPVAAQVDAPVSISTGNDLLGACQSPRASGPSWMCLGFVLGAKDAMRLNAITSRDALRFCMPAGVTNGQILAIVIKYVESVPEYRHQNASSLILVALLRAFPCPAKKV